MNTDLVGILGSIVLFFVVLMARVFASTPDKPVPVTNQQVQQDCLRTDRDRIAPYGEAKPAQACLTPETINVVDNQQ